MCVGPGADSEEDEESAEHLWIDLKPKGRCSPGDDG